MIEERLSVVQLFTLHEELADKMRMVMKHIGDLERLCGKIATGRINPREVLQLAKALQSVSEIKDICVQSKFSELEKLGEQLNPCFTIKKKIEQEIREDKL